MVCEHPRSFVQMLDWQGLVLFCFIYIYMLVTWRGHWQGATPLKRTSCDKWAHPSGVWGEPETHTHTPTYLPAYLPRLARLGEGTKRSFGVCGPRGCCTGAKEGCTGAKQGCTGATDFWGTISLAGQNTFCTIS